LFIAEYIFTIILYLLQGAIFQLLITYAFTSISIPGAYLLYLLYSIEIPLFFFLIFLLTKHKGESFLEAIKFFTNIIFAILSAILMILIKNKSTHAIAKWIEVVLYFNPSFCLYMAFVKILERFSM